MIPSRIEDSAEEEAIASRPWRALVLVGASRLTLAAAVTLTAWTVVTFVSTSSDSLDVAVPFAIATQMVPLEGSTPSELLDAVASRTGHTGTAIIAFEVGSPEGRIAPVKIQVSAPGGSEREVDRVVNALRQAGLTEVTPVTMLPTPAGFRIDIRASITLSVAPTEPVSDDRPVGVRLSGAVEQAAAELRRLDVPQDPPAPVRLEARGDMRALVRLLHEIETQHSAPLRFVSLSVRSVDGQSWDVVAVFHLRVFGPVQDGGSA
jgi:hypothetical protein